MEKRIAFRASKANEEYLAKIKKTFRCEDNSKAIRIVLDLAEEKKLGLSPQ